jgi:proteasome lid subunit RPN8/RPN11
MVRPLTPSLPSQADFEVVAREKLIGWYHTGPKLRASDLEINEVIKRYSNKPVMVIVDVRPDEDRSGGGIPTDAYFAVEEIKDVSRSFGECRWEREEDGDGS